MDRVAVYSGTRNLYEPMVWAAKSLVANSSVDRVFFLIEDGMFPYPLPDIVQTIDVSGFAAERFPDDGANANTTFTKMALVRACYPELFPNLPRILQLDVDTVCVDDVDPLWDVNLDDRWFAAVEEHLGNYNPYHADQYFNIGVAVFNLDQMRRDHAQELVMDSINTVKANCVEQDAFNFHGSLQDKIAELPVRWNETYVTGYTDDPAIVHFAGYRDWMTSPKAPRREYLKMYRDKPWSEVLEVRHG